MGVQLKKYIAPNGFTERSVLPLGTKRPPSTASDNLIEREAEHNHWDDSKGEWFTCTDRHNGRTWAHTPDSLDTRKISKQECDEKEREKVS